MQKLYKAGDNGSLRWYFAPCRLQLKSFNRFADWLIYSKTTDVLAWYIICLTSWRSTRVVIWQLRFLRVLIEISLIARPMVSTQRFALCLSKKSSFWLIRYVRQQIILVFTICQNLPKTDCWWGPVDAPLFNCNWHWQIQRLRCYGLSSLGLFHTKSRKRHCMCVAAWFN